MMKKYVIIGFLALLLVLSGCQKEDEGKTSTFYGGTDGRSV